MEIIVKGRNFAMDKKLTFSLVGGDARQGRLAELLASDGHNVSAYALEKCALASSVSQKNNMEELSKPSDCVILPIPIRSEGGLLNAPLSDKAYSPEDLFSLLPAGQTVIAGKIDNALFEKAGRSGIRLYDYLEREEFTVMNSVPTAEGAIEVAMHEFPGTLHGAHVLVLGFGHIGKLLSHYLRGLGASVTASARRFGDLAWISAYGYKPISTYDTASKLSGFDIIFNTIPAKILNREKLSLLDKSTLCIDLASRPGGIDFDAAKELGIKAISALSLPGRVAPLSAGVAMRDTVYNILSEWGIK